MTLRKDLRARLKARHKALVEVKSLASRLKAKRTREGKSLRDLAKVVGVAFSTLARLERGVGHPTEESAERIERWLAKGLASPPRVRPISELPWHLKIEERLGRIEDAIARIKRTFE